MCASSSSVYLYNLTWHLCYLVEPWFNWIFLTNLSVSHITQTINSILFAGGCNTSETRSKSDQVNSDSESYTFSPEKEAVEIKESVFYPATNVPQYGDFSVEEFVVLFVLIYKIVQERQTKHMKKRQSTLKTQILRTELCSRKKLQWHWWRNFSFLYFQNVYEVQKSMKLDCRSVSLKTTLVFASLKTTL